MLNRHYNYELIISSAVCRINKIVEDARLRAEKEEIERREQEKREAAERLLQENEVRHCHIAQYHVMT